MDVAHTCECATFNRFGVLPVLFHDMQPRLQVHRFESAHYLHNRLVDMGFPSAAKSFFTIEEHGGVKTVYTPQGFGYECIGEVCEERCILGPA